MGPYRVPYHLAVADEDIPRMPAKLRLRVAAAVERRLTEAPECVGTPLRGTLKGYWKLGIGDYRVVYTIGGREVQSRRSVTAARSTPTY